MSKHFHIHRRAGAVIGAAALVVAGLGIASIPAGASAADDTTPATSTTFLESSTTAPTTSVTPTEAPTTTEAPTSTTLPTTTTTLPAIACPADAGNARFVRFAYLHILFRCPDPAGLTYWTAQLHDGMTTAQFTNILDMSTENVINNNVNPLYSQWLHRAPTAAEATSAAAMIRSEEGDAGLQAILASSDESYNLLTDGGATPAVEGSTPADMDAAWLANVYLAVLDRNPDGLGMGYFGAILGAQSTAATRHTVFMTLEHSDENARDWTFSAYFASLGRPGDSGGLTYWSNWLLSSGNWRTFRMATYLMSSSEGQTLAQTQPNPPPDEH